MKPKIKLQPEVFVFCLKDGTVWEYVTVDGDLPGDTIGFLKKDGRRPTDEQHALLGEAYAYSQWIDRYSIDIFTLCDFDVYTLPFQDSEVYEEILETLTRLGFTD